ncbi:MAG: hypothetical protein B7Y95_04375 [Rhizobiales bacterium 32-66-11]|nr:MAG: hypothetical protein B7Y95_04375 [Rhizobiales bacterium 32-66-11]
MISRRSLLGGLLTAGIAAAAPIAASRQADAQIFIQPPPPPLRIERRPPPPRPGWVWVSGFWTWDPRRRAYVWVPGRWVAGRPGWRYRDGTWVRRGNTWVYRPGGWWR